MFGNEKLSSDAEILLGTGGGFAIHDDRSLYKNLLIFLKNDTERTKAGANSFRVFDGRTKASQKIAEVINKIVK